jgi:hypothetical protein
MSPSFIWLVTGPFEFGDTRSLASMVPSALVRLLVLYVDSKWGEIVTCTSMSGLGFMLILHRTMGPKMTCLCPTPKRALFEGSEFLLALLN